MPQLTHFPVYGQQRPGTNLYSFGGGAYGAYDGSFGDVVATNAAVAVATPDPLAQALRQQAAAAEARGLAQLTSGHSAAGRASIRTASILKHRAALAARAGRQRQKAIAHHRQRAIMAYRRAVGTP